MDLDQKLTAANALIKSTTSELHALQAELDRARSRIADLESDNAELKQKIDELENNKMELKKKLSETELNVQQLEREKRELQSEIEVRLVAVFGGDFFFLFSVSNNLALTWNMLRTSCDLRSPLKTKPSATETVS